MKMKKLFAVLLSVTMLLAMGTTAFAASGTNTNDGKITITNPEVGETYSVYQMFVLESYDSDSGAYAYTIDSTSAWYNFVSGSGAGADYVDLEQVGESTTYYVTWKGGTTDSDYAAFAKAALAYASVGNNRVFATASGMVNKDGTGLQTSSNAVDATTTSANYVSYDSTNKGIVFSNLSLGYYLVRSTLGTLLMLDTTNPTVEIVEKNSVPTIEKRVQEDSTGKYGKTNTADIGDVITYQITITAGAGARNYELHDNATSGLTADFNSITVVKYTMAENLTAFDANTTYYTYDSTTGTYTEVDTSNGAIPAEGTTYYTGKATLAASDDYTFWTNRTEEIDSNYFEIRFTEACLDGLSEGDIIVVAYTATVTSSAVIDKPYNCNTAYIYYGSEGFGSSGSINTYVYDVDIFKYTTKDGTEVGLPGASFVLYKTVDGTNYYAKVENGKLTGWTKNSSSDCKEDTNDSTYATTLTSNDEGKISVVGLDADTYYLLETAAPDGYNKLASPVEFVITEEGKVQQNNTNLDNDTIKIENNAGPELPTTGGIGTTILYIVGGLLVVGAVIFFVVRRRMRTEKQAD